ncbi:hypothetical protein T552_02007 [Pneumocystis carinii B80]|uniref:Transcription initiation factor TFIID subunit 8 n=1 Tax=Pneumocystis carinii (strain B80) TaxID=1408658 RepID=A0A0W4ZIH2_PNEC8|nr:hypothetical protein T552_02007 [Pneumocystis carinii B80]KTW28148.1 hypothetical protein T552_02007 [Pneumocystis carinii B80]
MREERFEKILERRAVVEILQSVGFSSAMKSSIMALERFLVLYIMKILDRSLRFAFLQRRYKISIYDIELMLFYEGIKIESLEIEMKQRIGRNYELEKDESISKATSRFMNTSSALVEKLLGPELTGINDERPDYHLSHLPIFPPKHTYMSTPVYVQRMTCPHKIRELSAKQSRLAENALWKIIQIENKLNLHKINQGPIKQDELFLKVWKDMGYEEDACRPYEGLVNWETSRYTRQLRNIL